MSGTILMDPGAVPSAAEMKGGLPAMARTVGGLRDVLVQQVATRGMKHTRWTVSAVDGSSANAGPITKTHRILHRCGPMGGLLWLGMHYMADEAGTAGAFIEVNVYSMTAVLIDGPIVWSDAAGTLTMTPTGVGRTLNPRTVGRDSFASTGWATGSGTTPRLLDASAYAGLDVEVTVRVVDARVWDVTISDSWAGVG